MGIALKEIRHALVNSMRGVPGAYPLGPVEDRVYGQPSTRPESGSCPQVYVMTLRESVSNHADSPRAYLRRAEVEINLIVEGVARHQGLEYDAVDEIGQLIEDFMAKAEFEGIRNVTFLSFDSGTSGEGSHPLGVGRWIYEIEYTETAPRVLIGEEVPLNTIHVHYDLAGSPEGSEAEDHLQTNTTD